MTITKENIHTVDSEVLRAIALDVRFHFYSFMDYCDKAIADMINANNNNREIPFQITPAMVACVRCGKPLHTL